jgi:hypothetical protein
MEGLTRLVTESLARYGLDRPVDFRRLQWSRWFRCESHHSLLCVPSKPGVFALAEDVMPLGQNLGQAYGGTAALGGPTSSATESAHMLAVLQFGEDDDMAFVLDRMFSRENPMRARLVSGRSFVRYVIIEDAAERRNTCNALNQWMISSGEKATGIGAHFATSLEVSVAPGPFPGTAFDHPAQAELDLGAASQPFHVAQSAPNLHNDNGSATNIHCPQPLPSGF